MSLRSNVAESCIAAVIAAMATAVTLPARASEPACDEAEVLAQASVVEGTLSIGDARLRYWDTGGNGPAVVLLHPGTGNLMSWTRQQPALAGAGYRVIGYSRRGHAGSDSGPGAAPPAASDLLQLLDALKVRRFHAVGVAAGGIYATDFALSHPDRLLSLTIAGSLVAIADADYMKRSSALRPAILNQLPSEFRELGPQYRASCPSGVAAWLAIERANAIDPAAQASARPTLENRLTLEALKTLRMPVLLMTGDADLYTPPALAFEIARAFPDSRTRVIDGAGHSANWEQPRAFNAVLLEFLASTTQR
ncbi:alpha/beta fold hydrolase [Rubrivivax gelatinosus]|uniref:Pimeloyl-ACP methyl ester carboxylesterase n=1 Tax=Rubrivivax gelatinosus TaxID=28068 RepID=A0A4R2M7K6_RUBGE|nr:alpha/beta hydrolase [Rubrivivax gelatinosus]MBK1687217.1 hypothetical protein [Rubrivivax gelatinosus]TCP02622.1 pimeloyl-ACP methyl ester carboxylesterase [Rubrivivax gelatinosus]